MVALDRYGPWALVLGASDGIGEEVARAVAREGIHLVLVARRRATLDEVAASIRDQSGVEVRTLSVDLTDPGAMPAIVEATADVEVGLLFYAAGGDPNYEPFLTQPVDNALALIERNCVVPIRLCHHFAGPMRDRGRGGIVLVSSGAALVGGRNMVAYGATKAFDMLMAEALWTELHDAGVDVLSLVIGLTDTPQTRRLLVRRGEHADMETPVPGASTPAEVAAEALSNLADGPTLFATDDVRAGAEVFATMSRNDAVRMVLSFQDDVMGKDEGAQ